jgi:hypothetical protein
VCVLSFIGVRIQSLTFDDLEKVALSEAFVEAMHNIGKVGKRHYIMTTPHTGISVCNNMNIHL